VVYGDPRDADFVRQVLERYSPDAFLCENDLIATHLMQTLGRLDLSVPGDIGVVGFNDLGMARHLETPLTTVRQPCQEIGNAAVDTMTWRLENRDAPARTVLVDPQLVVRGSSAKSK
jgi:LacI family transcriptional regulator